MNNEVKTRPDSIHTDDVRRLAGELLVGELRGEFESLKLERRGDWGCSMIIQNLSFYYFLFFCLEWSD